MTFADYLALIPSQHKDKPDYIAVLQGLLQPTIDLQNINFDDEFDIDLAVGVQLDILGEWIGISRNITTPLTNVYFTWDSTDSVGWNFGVWKDEFDPDSGLVSLPDDSYRVLLKAKIAANHWDGTTEKAYQIWDSIFTDIFAIRKDNMDMSISIAIAGRPLDAVDLALITGGYLTLKPMGVRIKEYEIVPDGGQLFGWDIENEAFAGWESGKWATIYT